MECRLCLNKSPSKCIFSLQYTFTQTIIALLKINEDDGLPKLICQRCSNKIKNIDNFIKKCEDSDSILRRKIIQEIKNEPTTACEMSEDNNDMENEAKIIIETDLVDKAKDGDDVHSDYYDLVHSTGLEYESNSVKDEQLKMNKKVRNKQRNETKRKISKQKKMTIKKLALKNEEIIIEDSLNLKKKRCYKKGSYSRDYSEGRLCPFCGMCYTNRDAYSLHLKKHSEDEFQCDFCSRMFNHKAALKRHIKCHMQKERYSCRFCHKLFKYKNYVSKHEEVVHIKTKPDFNCLVCGKGFYAKNYLRVHMLIHTGIRNVQCHICSKTFLRKGALRKHLAYHSDDRPFVCRYCPNAFKNAEHRKKHERLHTGETPHKCPVCLKGFAQKCNMRSHFVHNHKELDFNETMAQFQKNQESQQGVSVT